MVAALKCSVDATASANWHRRVEGPGVCLMQKKVPRIGSRVAWLCASSCCTRSFARLEQRLVDHREAAHLFCWASPSVMIQWRAISCAVTSPLLGW